MKQKHSYDMIVIGGGPSGMVAADLMTRSGHKTALVEAEKLGGENAHYGTIPMKALLHATQTLDTARRASRFGLRTSALGYNFPSLFHWKNVAISRTGSTMSETYLRSVGIDVINGSAHFIDRHTIAVGHTTLTAKQFIIATGATPRLPAEVTGITKLPVLTPRTAFELGRPPRTLFIIGAGATGCEFADFFATLGSQVTLADMQPRIMSQEDTEVSDVLESILTKRRGTKILTSVKITKISREGLTYRISYLHGGAEHHAKAEQVLVATGKMPQTDLGLENAGINYSYAHDYGIPVNDYLQTSMSHIYAIGSVTGQHFYTHTAVQEARIAAHNAVHRKKTAVNYEVMPRITFTTPEVASVGMSEAQCLKRDLRLKKAIAPLSSITRANINDEYDGFCKVMANKSGHIIGATIVAPHAGEMIHELALAMQYGLTAGQVAATIHAYPSWSEVVRTACANIARE